METHQSAKQVSPQNKRFKLMMHRSDLTFI
jgi:hypothetical protein